MKLTIFTPTFNRPTLLNILYGSILDSLQGTNSSDSVEWLIVDDGSTTDYSNIVSSFKEQSNFKIKYIKKKNGGKHTAFNLAIEESCGDLFVCIDDDDKLLPDSIARIFELSKKLLKNNNGGIVGRVVDASGKLLGKTVFEDYLESNTIEIRDKYKFWGEPEIYNVKHLKKYKFLEIENEKFLTEAYLFDKMSTDYPFIYTNVPLMVKEYLPNGLTANQLKIRIESPVGTEEYYFQRKLMCKGFINKLKATINRQRFSCFTKKQKKRKIDFYEIIATPFSFILKIKDKSDYKKMKK